MSKINKTTKPMSALNTLSYICILDNNIEFWKKICNKYHCKKCLSNYKVKRFIATKVLLNLQITN
jgi:hypothetical protein